MDKEEKRGETPLYEASENRNVEVVKVLITAGANVDKGEDRG